MPMRKYHFSGPMDLPRLLLILIMLAGFAIFGSIVLSAISTIAFIALIPVLSLARGTQIWAWIRRCTAKKV